MPFLFSLKKSLDYFLTGLVVINSFTFCLSRKLFTSPSILNDNLARLDSFSLSVLRVYHATGFCPAKFLLKNLLIVS